MQTELTHDLITYKEISGDEYNIYAGLKYEIAPGVEVTMRPATPVLCESVNAIKKPKFLEEGTDEEKGNREREITHALIQRVELCYAGIPDEFDWLDKVGVDMIARLESDFLLMSALLGSARVRRLGLLNLQSLGQSTKKAQ